MRLPSESGVELKLAGELSFECQLKATSIFFALLFLPLVRSLGLDSDFIFQQDNHVIQQREECQKRTLCCLIGLAAQSPDQI